MKKHVSILWVIFVAFLFTQVSVANPSLTGNMPSQSTEAEYYSTANGILTTAPPASKCYVSNVQISNIVYTVGTKSSSVLQNVVQPGKKVKVSFTVPKSSYISTFSFVSYKAPYAVFVEKYAHLQVVFDSKTIDVGKNGGRVSMEINVPDCFFQVDFVKGCVIKQLGPEGTNNFYGKQQRLISFAHGGTVNCGLTGSEGCTPGYWKNHTDRWEGYKTSDNFFTAFGISTSYSRGLSTSMTLIQAVNLGGGGFASLARHATAGLLSASNKGVNYTYTTTQIKTMVQNAFRTGNAESAKKLLEAANEKDCPLGGTPATTSQKPMQSIEEPEGNQLTAYPTPFSDESTIEFTLTKSESYTINLYDMKGRLVKQLKTGTAKAGEASQVEVEGNTLVEGVYLIRMVSESETKTLKLFKKQ